MKKKIFSMMGVILFLLLPVQLSGCGKEENKPIEQKIVFLFCQGNHASVSISNYRTRGYCIDNRGYKVAYDLEWMGTSKLYEYLLEHLETMESQPFLSEEELRTCYTALYKVDPEAKMERRSGWDWLDMSSDILYGVQLSETGAPIWITLRRYGSPMLRNTDENAQEIINLVGWDTWMSGNRDEEATGFWYGWDSWDDTEGWEIWEW